MGRLIPLRDAAQEHGVSRETIYRLVRQKKLRKFRRTGDRRTFVDEDEVRAALGWRAIDPE